MKNINRIFSLVFLLIVFLCLVKAKEYKNTVEVPLIYDDGDIILNQEQKVKVLSISYSVKELVNTEYKYRIYSFKDEELFSGEFFIPRELIVEPDHERNLTGEFFVLNKTNYYLDVSKV